MTSEERWLRSAAMRTGVSAAVAERFARTTVSECVLRIATLLELPFTSQFFQRHLLVGADTQLTTMFGRSRYSGEGRSRTCCSTS